MIKKLTKPILISYGALAVPLAALGLPLTVYLPPFYEGPIGLSVGTVGIIFMVARFWDIFTDPLMGALVDRYPSKWGRRKHWIVIGIPILMLASWYVFIPSEGEKTAIYLAFWLFILYLRSYLPTSLILLYMREIGLSGIKSLLRIFSELQNTSLATSGINFFHNSISYGISLLR